jgi:3'-phosphoadenosine 5'-phosphosulfate sulfotransferase (PAPS reductase)/FAD synthetase
MSEAVYTIEDLRRMQAWPLEKKIEMTQARIAEWYSHYHGKVAVSFSGGKDSTIALELTRQLFPEVPAVYVDTGLEYPEIVEFVKSVPNVTWLRPERSFSQIVAQYGYPVISKDVAHHVYYARKGSTWAINHLNGMNPDGSHSWYCQRYMKWRFLLEAPFLISDHCCNDLKTRPISKYRRETGNMAILATLACESKRREGAFLRTGCTAYNKKEPTCQPLAFWLEQDVLEYLRLTGIPYASIYGDIVERNGKLITTGAQRTGCMFCMMGLHLEKKPNRFQRMALTHPDQHNFCINTLGCGKVLDYIGVPYQPLTDERSN